jgi:hypothetical protein
MAQHVLPLGDTPDAHLIGGRTAISEAWHNSNLANALTLQSSTRRISQLCRAVPPTSGITMSPASLRLRSVVVELLHHKGTGPSTVSAGCN